MADYTLSSGNVCEPYRTPWGAFHTRHYAVSSGVSSATIHVGRPVTLDYTLAGNTSNAGYVKASTADNTFYLVGIAGAEASGSTAVNAVTTIPVYEANPMQEFSAVTKGGTLQSSQVGLTKTLHSDSTLNVDRDRSPGRRDPTAQRSGRLGRPRGLPVHLEPARPGQHRQLVNALRGVLSLGEG
jgi:hypothetical protein